MRIESANVIGVLNLDRLPKALVRACFDDFSRSGGDDRIPFLGKKVHAAVRKLLVCKMILDHAKVIRNHGMLFNRMQNGDGFGKFRICKKRIAEDGIGRVCFKESFGAFCLVNRVRAFRRDDVFDAADLVNAILVRLGSVQVKFCAVVVRFEGFHVLLDFAVLRPEIQQCAVA